MKPKPLMVDPLRCRGPLVALPDGRLLYDLTRENGALGIGHQAGALFGTAQYSAAWTGDPADPEFAGLVEAWRSFLLRKAGWEEGRIALHPSPAAALHWLLSRLDKVSGGGAGECWITLNTCLNKYSGADGVLKDGNVGGAWVGIPAPAGNDPSVLESAWPEATQQRWTADWRELGQRFVDAGAAAGARRFKGLESDWSEGEHGPSQLEWQALRELVRHLSESATQVPGRRIAGMLLPASLLDCGDLYLPVTFLVAAGELMAGAGLTLVLDETGSGFHAGREYFWHRQMLFGGEPVTARWIVSGVPGGSGFVLGPESAALLSGQFAEAPEEGSGCPVWPRVESGSSRRIHPAQLALDYIASNALDQLQAKVWSLEEQNRSHLQDWVVRHADRFANPRGVGLCFAMDLVVDPPEPGLLAIGEEEGICFSLSGPRCLAFRLNTALTGSDLERIWSRLDRFACRIPGTIDDGPPPPLFPPERPPGMERPVDHARYHEALIVNKMRGFRHAVPQGGSAAVRFLEQSLADSGLGDCQVVLVTAANWSHFRERVEAMQQLVYEPARRTAIYKFDELVQSANSHSLIALRGEEIVAMAFAGPLSLFADERGTTTDPQFHDPAVLYMLDLSVRQEYRGSLGRVMKQAITLAAVDGRSSAIHGRNRDRLAGGMWAINLGLGSYQTRHFRDDYPDQERYRDCIYYRCPLKWSGTVDLTGAVRAPLALHQLHPVHLGEQLATFPVRLPSGRFATAARQKMLQEIAGWFSDRLQPWFATADRATALYRLVAEFEPKSTPSRPWLWLRRGPSDQQLSGRRSANSHLDSAPGLRGFKTLEWSPERVPDLTAAGLDLSGVAGVILEPLARDSLERFEPEHLSQIMLRCRERGLPVILDETASQGFRYDPVHFGVAGWPELVPDAVLAELGQALTMVFRSSAMPGPATELLQIDADERSLSTYHGAFREWCIDPEAGRQTIRDFDRRLREWLAACGGVAIRIRHGVGSFVIPGSADLTRLGRWFPAAEAGAVQRVLPAPGAMQQFLETEGSEAGHG